MSKSGQTKSTDTPVGWSETELTAELRAYLRTRAMRHGVRLALIATAGWYLFWFMWISNLSAWSGALAFAIALILGFLFAYARLIQRVAEELRRRRDLLALRDKLRRQNNSTT